MSKELSLDEEHEARDIIRLYSETLREDAMKFDKDFSEAREPTKLELIAAERVSVYKHDGTAKL